MQTGKYTDENRCAIGTQEEHKEIQELLESDEDAEYFGARKIRS
jgi:hypothetical protein